MLFAKEYVDALKLFSLHPGSEFFFNAISGGSGEIFHISGE